MSGAREITYLRDRLHEEQRYSQLASDALIMLGHHPQGIHQLPDDYDSESAFACVAPECIRKMVADHRWS